MMKSINHDDFELSRTPEKLKELFVLRDESFYMIGELTDLLMRLTNGDWKAFVDQAFRGEIKNAEVYFEIEQQGYRAIEAGLELISLIELWRDHFELGDDVEIVQRSCFSRTAVRALIDSQEIVQRETTWQAP